MTISMTKLMNAMTEKGLSFEDCFIEQRDDEVVVTNKNHARIAIFKEEDVCTDVVKPMSYKELLDKVGYLDELDASKIDFRELYVMHSRMGVLGSVLNETLENATLSNIERACLQHELEIVDSECELILDRIRNGECDGEYRFFELTDSGYEYLTKHTLEYIIGNDDIYILVTDANIDHYFACIYT